MNDFKDEDFRQLYDRYSGPLFRFIYRFTVNVESTEEILHDIFIELLSGKYSQREDADLKSWLYTLAKNKSLNHLKRFSHELKKEEAAEDICSNEDMESQTIGANLLQKLSAATDTLPLDLQQTWDLKKQGFDHEKIAATLSIPIGTVKSRIHRLVLLLKKEFKNEL